MSLHHMVCRMLLVSIWLPVLAGALSAQYENTKIEKAMQTRIAKVEAEFVDEKRDDAELELHKTPLLSFTDPTRKEIDGKLWLWHADSVPVALLSLTYHGNVWSYEHVTLGDDAVEFTTGADWKWTPKPRTRKWFRFDGEVSGKPGVRKIQMRAILRQLEAKEYLPEEYALRLVPRPVYLYSKDSSSILAGGLFAFSHGTNPEVIVRIEARRDESGEAAWFVSFARLSSAEVEVIHDEKTIWNTPIIRQADRRAGYWAYGVPITEPELRKDNE